MSFGTSDRTTRTRVTGGRAALRVGFVPLIDAAPLIAAAEMGYFADESVAVTLERQIGWGNVRDKLTFGQLDASHALVGMPPASQLNWEAFSEPLVSLMTLSTGGDAITLSKSLVDRGVTSATALGEWIRSRGPDERRLRLAHVFGCSAHHYLLRTWLKSGGVDPDRDVALCVVPPAQVGWQLAEDCIDGFCAGEPWNTLAQRDGHGVIVAATVDLIPDHPEKVLAVSRRWSTEHSDVAERLVHAVLRGCAYCSDPGNHSRLAEMLSSKEYVGLPTKVIESSLAFAGATDTRLRQSVSHPSNWRPRSFDPAGAFPSATHMAWVLDKMRGAGQATFEDEADLLAIARRCCDAGPYRRAARDLGIALPVNDFPPMRLRGGLYDPLTEHQRRRPEPVTAS